MAAVCDVYEPHLDLARKLADPKALRHQALPGNPRPQGHRRRADRQPGPLARADDRGRLRRRQGRLCREAADAQPGRGPAVIEAQNQASPDRAGRHAAAEHAAVREGPRADPGRPDRHGAQGPPDLEPQQRPGPPRTAGRRPEDSSTGRPSSATPPSSRSTTTASATGAGSGISAAASSPT